MGYSPSVAVANRPVQEPARLRLRRSNGPAQTEEKRYNKSSRVTRRVYPPRSLSTQYSELPVFLTPPISCPNFISLLQYDLLSSPTSDVSKRLTCQKGTTLTLMFSLPSLSHHTISALSLFKFGIAPIQHDLDITPSSRPKPRS